MLTNVPSEKGVPKLVSVYISAPNHMVMHPTVKTFDFDPHGPWMNL